MARPLISLPLATLVTHLACGCGSVAPSETVDASHVADASSDDAGTDASTSGDAGRDAGTDAGRDAGRDAGTDAGRDAGTDAGMPPSNVLRFAVLGDAGEGDASQYAVGARLASVCATMGCDFVLYLGDNFYDSGVTSVDDMQFQTKFELPYEDVGRRFYVVLGNHDYGLEGAGLDWSRGPIQVEYTQRSATWYMPAEYYTFERGDVTFFAFDTNAILHGRTNDEQAAMVESVVASGTRPWRIGFGHHPYRSNGAHGNAGNYEGLPWLPVLNGANVRDFFEEELCGNLDVFFAGHDHNRQWLTVDCGMLHVVSGAGAKTTGLEYRDGNTYAYSDATEPGFLWVEIRGDALLGRFYDADGNIDFQEMIVRPSLGQR